MDLSAEKLELVKMLLETDNTSVLKKIKSTLLSAKKDETSYLLSSKANIYHLEKGMKQVNNGQVKTIDLADLWK